MFRGTERPRRTRARLFFFVHAKARIREDSRGQPYFFAKMSDEGDLRRRAQVAKAQLFQRHFQAAPARFGRWLNLRGRAPKTHLAQRCEIAARKR